MNTRTSVDQPVYLTASFARAFLFVRRSFGEQLEICSMAFAVCDHQIARYLEQFHALRCP